MPAGEVEYCLFQQDHPVENEGKACGIVADGDKLSHILPIDKARRTIGKDEAQPRTPAFLLRSSFVKPTIYNILHEVMPQMALDLSGVPIGTR